MRVLQEIELTAREADFVRAVCEGLAPSAAAVKAGWNISSAPRLMRKPCIVAAIFACGENARAALQKIAERKPNGADAGEAQ